MTETLIDVLSWVLLVLGGGFYLVGAVGLTRMPDLFTRMHAVSVGETMGAGLLFAGMLLQAGPTLVGAKLVTILLVLLFSSSVVTHALAKAALQDKLYPLVADADGNFVETSPDETAELVTEMAAKDGRPQLSNP